MSVFAFASNSERVLPPHVRAWTVHRRVRRKTEELNECFEQGESDPQKIDECDNFADPQTKYLVGKVWYRHLHYTHNLDGEPPPAVVKTTKKVKFDDAE